MKKAFSVAGTRIVGTIAQGLTFLVLTQSLGPVSFGSFATIMVTFTFVSALVGFGSGSLALRVQSSSRPASLAASVSLLRYITITVAALSVLLISIYVFNIRDAPLLIAGILFGLLEASYRAVENILFGLEKTKRAQISMVFRRVTVLASVILGSIWGVSLEFLSATVSLLILSSPFWLLRLLDKPLNLTATIKLSLPYWGADILARLQTLDVAIATLAVNPVGAGVYAAASRVSSPLNILASSVLSVLTPQLSREKGATRLETSNRSMRFLLIVCAGLIAISPAVGFLLEWVLGTEYAGVALPAALLCVAAGVAAINQGQVAFLYASSEARRLFWTRLFVIPPAMLSGIPLGLSLGAVGIALAVVLSQLLQVIFLRWQVLRIKSQQHARISNTSSY